MSVIDDCFRKISLKNTSSSNIKKFPYVSANIFLILIIKRLKRRKKNSTIYPRNKK